MVFGEFLLDGRINWYSISVVNWFWTREQNSNKKKHNTAKPQGQASVIRHQHKTPHQTTKQPQNIAFYVTINTAAGKKGQVNHMYCQNHCLSASAVKSTFFIIFIASTLGIIPSALCRKIHTSFVLSTRLPILLLMGAQLWDALTIFLVTIASSVPVFNLFCRFLFDVAIVFTWECRCPWIDLLVATGRTVTFWDLGASLCQHVISELGSFVTTLFITLQLNMFFVFCQLKHDYHLSIVLILVSNLFHMCKVYTVLKSSLDINLEAISVRSRTMTRAQKILQCKLEKGCESVLFIAQSSCLIVTILKCIMPPITCKILCYVIYITSFISFVDIDKLFVS